MKTKSAILQMLYGKRGTFASIIPAKKYQRLLGEVIRCEKELIEKLSAEPELLTLYQTLDEFVSLLRDEAVYMHYKDGFRFGLLMGLDTAERN